MAQPVRIGLMGFGRVARTYLRWYERLRWRGDVQHVIACDLLEKHHEEAIFTYNYAQCVTNY